MSNKTRSCKKRKILKTKVAATQQMTTTTKAVTAAKKKAATMAACQKLAGRPLQQQEFACHLETICSNVMEPAVLQSKSIGRKAEDIAIDKLAGLPDVFAGLELPEGVVGFDRAQCQ